MTSIRSRVLAALGLFLFSALLGCRGQHGVNDQPWLTPAQDLLGRSIAYHDPNGVWGRDPIQLHWTSRRPDGQVGFVFEIEMAANGDFSMVGERSGREFEYRVLSNEMLASVDGNAQLTEEDRKQLGLVRDNGLFWRDYLGFLGGFPMCLRNSGARLRPEVTHVELDGRQLLAFDVDFAPEVGEDTYTFYFEEHTARLVGCRFYREDPATDGETILFEGESSVSGLRLPRTRRWYTNADNRFLGTDEILASALRLP